MFAHWTVHSPIFFEFPDFLKDFVYQLGLPNFVEVQHAEMSQQLCKAALFKDKETFKDLFKNSMIYTGEQTYHKGRHDIKNFN